MKTFDVIMHMVSNGYSIKFEQIHGDLIEVTIVEKKVNNVFKFVFSKELYTSMDVKDEVLAKMIIHANDKLNSLIQ